MSWALGLVATVVAAAVLCFVVPRVAVIAAATLAWPLVFLGLDRGWWGSGLGDGWQPGAVSLTAAALAGSIGGFLARVRSRRPVSPPTFRGDGLRPGS